FDVGKAAGLQRPIAQGGPLLFQALRGSTLDLFVQHVGADPVHGWLAFEAHRPGGPRGCLLRWRPNDHRFVDPCDGRSYPADGQDLDHYAVSIDGSGNVIVDLRQPTGTSPSPT